MDTSMARQRQQRSVPKIRHGIFISFNVFSFKQKEEESSDDNLMHGVLVHRLTMKLQQPLRQISRVRLLEGPVGFELGTGPRGHSYLQCRCVKYLSFIAFLLKRTVDLFSADTCGPSLPRRPPPCLSARPLSRMRRDRLIREDRDTGPMNARTTAIIDQMRINVQAYIHKRKSLDNM